MTRENLSSPIYPKNTPWGTEEIILTPEKKKRNTY